jgi:ABC-type multidrug transport system ATPase subunit
MNIQTHNLSKTYRGGIQALDDINIEIGTGMFGLLGPNGAGKTTLMRILATLLKPTRGRATVGGFDVSDRQQKWAVKAILGYLPQELGLYPSLTVIEFLDYIAILKKIHDSDVRAENIEEVLAMAGLVDQADQRIKTLSGGMKRRVGIAQALLGKPQVLIVDEPTSGLDPEERVRFRTLLASLSSERIVILSTHIVQDIASTCHNMMVLNKGKEWFRGNPETLIQAAQGQVWEMTLPEKELPDPSWHIATNVQNTSGQQLRIIGPRPHESAQSANPTLEEAYLHLMADASSDHS